MTHTAGKMIGPDDVKCPRCKKEQHVTETALLTKGYHKGERVCLPCDDEIKALSN